MKSSVHVYTVQYKYYHKCTVEARKSLVADVLGTMKCSDKDA